jgi:hypothetical protein
VNVSPGYFDDRTLAGQTLWGVHVSASPAQPMCTSSLARSCAPLMPNLRISA